MSLGLRTSYSQVLFPALLSQTLACLIDHQSFLRVLRVQCTAVERRGRESNRVSRDMCQGGRVRRCRVQRRHTGKLVETPAISALNFPQRELVEIACAAVLNQTGVYWWRKGERDGESRVRGRMEECVCKQLLRGSRTTGRRL